MTPYYDLDGITIYHARCEDVLPSIDPATVDLLLTDTPYGIDLDTDYTKKHGAGAGSFVAIADDDEPFDPAPLLAYGRCVLWGANNFSERLPDAPAWLVWDKVCVNLPTSYRSAEAELAWTNVTRRMQVFHHQWMGASRDTERGRTLHPSQKPVSLMAWIVDRWTKPGDLVLDPYRGSGPVAQACHELGRRYIGIELVEDYCAVAVSRLSQQTLDFGGAA